jgi:hypothetical protein
MAETEAQYLKRMSAEAAKDKSELAQWLSREWAHGAKVAEKEQKGRRR